MTPIQLYSGAVCSIDPFQAAPVQDQRWTIVQRDIGGSFEKLAVDIRAMAKYLSIDAGAYAKLLEDREWSLALPVSREDFFARWLENIDLKNRSSIGDLSRDKITQVWMREIAPLKDGEEMAAEVPGGYKIFRTDSGMTFVVRLFNPLGGGRTATVWDGLNLFTGKPCVCNISTKPFDRQLTAYSVLPRIQPEIYDAISIGGRHILFQERFSHSFASAYVAGLINTPEKYVAILVQLSFILIEMRKKGFIHRDLSYVNVLLLFEGNTVKATLCDYEFCTHDQDFSFKKKPLGNVVFVPPECAKSWAEKGDFGDSVGPSYDIFSLAVLACAEGDIEVPWNLESDTDTLIELSRYTERHWMGAEPEDKTSMRYLIWCMTHPDPERRPTAEKVLYFLLENHY